MTEREQIMHALNCAGILPLLPAGFGVRFLILGSALRCFAVDERSGAPQAAPAELAPVRRRAIAAARGVAPPFSWWHD